MWAGGGGGWGAGGRGGGGEGTGEGQREECSAREITKEENRLHHGQTSSTVFTTSFLQPLP